MECLTKTIDASDYYVLLIARRYGSINEKTNLGYTEQEFDYAVQKGVPCLVFLLDESASWPGTYTDTDADAVSRLKAFKAKASANRQVAFWTNSHDLPFMVITALSNAFSDDQRPGWVRPSPIASPEVAEELARLSRENAELNELVRRNSTLSEMEATKKTLSNSKIYLPTIKVDVLACFEELSEFILFNSFNQNDISSYFAERYLNGNKTEDAEQAGMIFLSSTGELGLIKMEIVGVVQGGEHQGEALEPYVEKALILTDEGRRFIRYLALNRPEDDKGGVYYRY